MPTKNDVVSNKIYFNNGDRMIPVERIEDIEMDGCETQPDKTITGLANSLKEFLFTVDCTAATIRNLLKTIVPNNWRKMHHVPILRKTDAERRKKWVASYAKRIKI